MDGQQFDRITRALASGTPRRNVLKGALGGALAGLLGRSHVLAQDVECPEKVGICHRTNSKRNPFNYIEICVDSVPEHAAHGDLVSCPGAGFIDPESCTCACDLVCEGNFVEDEETCACVCPVETITCPVGETLNPETCACEAGPDPECAGQVCETFTACNENANCGCATTGSGGGFCVQNAACAEFVACGAGNTCAEGFVCLVGTCCGTPVCVSETANACPQPSASARSASVEVNGPSLLGN